MRCEWADTAMIAEFLGLTDRAVRKGLAVGRLCRRPVRSRRIKGAGGDAGERWEGFVPDIPGLEAHLKARSTPLAPRGSLTNPALVYEIWSACFADLDAAIERGEFDASLNEWSKKHLVSNNGKEGLKTYSKISIKRLYKAYKRHGLGALGRQKRKDAGTKRAFISMKFDAAARGAGLQDNDLRAIADAVKTHIRSWHKSWEGVGNIRGHASRHLKNLTNERGVELPPDTYEVPLRLVKEERAIRTAAKLYRDRKGYEDAKPRIKRTIAGLEPMDVVVGDVHHLDFLGPELEGYQRYPKAICWFDVATGRMWMTIVFLRKGEGIRNDHVMASFMEMTATHPDAWGMMKFLYLDNGSEYNFTPLIEDMLKLGPKIDWLDSGRENGRVSATPYNAPAKPIENRFRVLEYSYFPKIPGWVGGDRYKPKAANVGKPLVGYPTTQDALRISILNAVLQYNVTPAQTGEYKGRSPIQIFNDFVEAGWKKTAVDADAFLAAFSIEKRVKNNGGSVKADGRVWTCDALAACVDEYIIVLIPKFQQWDHLPIKDVRGNLLGFAEEDRPFGFLDPAGARESKRRQRIRLISTQDHYKSAPTIDVEAELQKLAQTAPKQLPAPIGACVTASDAARTIAQGVKEGPKAKQERVEAERRREHEQQRALSKEYFEKFEAKKAREA